MGKNQPNNFRKNHHCKGHTLKQVNIFPTDPRHPHLWHLEADWRSPPELHWKKDHQETGFCKSHKYKPLPWRTSFLQHKEIHSDSFVMRHIMNRDDHWRDLVVSSLNPSQDTRNRILDWVDLQLNGIKSESLICIIGFFSALHEICKAQPQQWGITHMLAGRYFIIPIWPPKSQQIIKLSAKCIY